MRERRQRARHAAALLRAGQRAGSQGLPLHIGCAQGRQVQAVITSSQCLPGCACLLHVLASAILFHLTSHGCILACAPAMCWTMLGEQCKKTSYTSCFNSWLCHGRSCARCFAVRLPQQWEACQGRASSACSKAAALWSESSRMAAGPPETSRHSVPQLWIC